MYCTTVHFGALSHRQQTIDLGFSVQGLGSESPAKMRAAVNSLLESKLSPSSPSSILEQRCGCHVLFSKSSCTSMSPSVSSVDGSCDGLACSLFINVAESVTSGSACRLWALCVSERTINSHHHYYVATSVASARICVCMCVCVCTCICELRCAQAHATTKAAFGADLRCINSNFVISQWYLVKGGKPQGDGVQMVEN